MRWCASVSSCSKARDKSCNQRQGQDQSAGMVESRGKASDASGAAGSQQGCSDKRPQGKICGSAVRRRAMSCIVEMQGNRTTSQLPSSKKYG